jgi:hypothetical protein
LELFDHHPDLGFGRVRAHVGHETASRRHGHTRTIDGEIARMQIYDDTLALPIDVLHAGLD